MTVPAQRDAKPVDLDKWEGCDAMFDGNPKIRCSMVKGDGHGPVHKHIKKNGRVTHRWPSPLAGEEVKR